MRSAWALLFALALAAVVIATGEWAHEAARSSQHSLAERSRARLIVAGVLRRLVDAETAQRGYLLTGRREHLAPYRDADADVLRGLAEVREHFSGDAASAEALETLNRGARKRLAELATTIAMRDAGDARWMALLVADGGRATMDGARAAARRLMALEDERIDAERAVIDAALDRGRVVVHATTLLALIGFVFLLRKQRALAAAQREQARLQDARETERRDVARRLHDDLGAMFTAAKLDMTRLKRAWPEAATRAAGERLAHLDSMLDDGVALKRRLIETLSPAALHHLGLRAAIEFLVADFRRRSGIAVALDAREVALAEPARIVVYRLVQECLHNLQRHAGAGSAGVVLRPEQGEALVRVCDDGRGFDPARVPPERHGLLELRQRIAALGGRLEVRSAPGRGTRIEAHLPLAANPRSP